ncbi:hypothetical protein [Nocardioides sambongensis]|uniref:hypothetical protein n=1 Tax=Nocardioides sambongensis TaxID=2589074 RepID=UPI0015E82F3D|nr:hypothetical protein [Nocardioides sambongensis]
MRQADVMADVEAASDVEAGSDVEAATLSAPDVLDRVRSARRSEEAAARDKLIACVEWAAIHSCDTIVGPADSWHEQELPLGAKVPRPWRSSP